MPESLKVQALLQLLQVLPYLPESFSIKFVFNEVKGISHRVSNSLTFFNKDKRLK